MAVQSATSSAMEITERKSGAIGMTSTKVGDSGIDGAALANIPEQVAEARTKIIQDKIDFQTKKNEELESLRPDLETLSSVVNTMRGMSKASGVQNVFNKRFGAAVGKESGLEQSSVAINTDDGASIRSIKVKIAQKATADTLTSGASPYHGSKTTALNLQNGNLTINGATIAVNNTMTLEDVAAAINTSDIFNVQGVTAEVQKTTVLGIDFFRLSLVPAAGGKLTITDDQAGAITNNLHCVWNQYLPLGLTGDLVIDGRTVSIDPSMTIYDIKNNIQTECSQQSVEPCDASVDQRGPGDNRLFLFRKDTGAPMDLTGSSGSILSALGWTLAGSGKTVDDLIAKYSVDFGDGTWVDQTSTTNTVENLIDKVSMTITDVTPLGDDVTITVEPFLDSIKSQIVSFVDGTNKVLAFLNKHAERGPDGKPVTDAILSGNSFVRDMGYKILSSLNKTVAGLSSDDYTSLNSLGITLAKDTTGFSLQLNEATLNGALNADPDKVMWALSFRFETSNSSFLMPTSPQLLESSLAGKDIGVRVTKQAGEIKAYYTLNGTEYDAEIDEKGKITPKAGTPLTSLAPLYLMSSVYSNMAEGETQTSTIKLTQGVMDVLGNRLKSIVQKGLSVGGKTLIQAGSLENEEKSIDDDIAAKEKKIEDINAKAEREKEKILKQFERLQGLLEFAKQMRAMVAAYMDSQNRRN